MFQPIFSLRLGPGIKFLHGLGVDVPPIISLKRGPGIKFLLGLGVDVLACNFYWAWARHKIS